MFKYPTSKYKFFILGTLCGVLLLFLSNGAAIGQSTNANNPKTTVTSPNGGEVWARNSVQTITWQTTGVVANVSIQLVKGSYIYRSITKSTLNTGSYQWVIPANLPEGTNYKIRVKGTGAAYLALDRSDNFFSIQGLVAGPVPTLTPISIPSALGNNAQFISQTVPTTMNSGQTYTTYMTFKNTGTAAWSSSVSSGSFPYKLGSQNLQDNLTWGKNRILIPSGSVLPGQQETFVFTVTAPSTPGTYNFQWRMVQDGKEWFGDYSPNVSIVVGTASGAPTVSLRANSTTVVAGQPFTLTITGTSGVGLAAVWWYGQNTGVTNANVTSAFPASPTSLASFTTPVVNPTSLDRAFGSPLFSASQAVKTYTFTSTVTISTPGTYTLGANSRDVLYPTAGEPHQASEGTGLAYLTINVVSATPTPTPTADCGVVQGLQSSVSGNNITLSWQPVVCSKAVGVYNIYRSTTQGFIPFPTDYSAPYSSTDPRLNMVIQGNVLTYTFNNLPYNTYYFRVAAQYVDGIIASPSAELKVIVPASATPAPTPTPTLTDNAVYVGESSYTSIAAGQVYPVSITMKNTGTSTWTKGALFRLGSQNPQDNLTWGLGRVELAASESIAPGAQKAFNFNITAPSTPGLYNFQWKMVHEGVSWFGNFSTLVPVNVYSTTPTPTPTPTPTNSAACITDTDRSLNYGLAGYTTFSSGSYYDQYGGGWLATSGGTLYDACVDPSVIGAGVNLKEVYCDGNSTSPAWPGNAFLNVGYVYCSNGCSNGACR